MTAFNGGSWSYSEDGFGPERWHKRYVGTKTDLQSPIHIETAFVTKESSLGVLSHSYEPSPNGTLTNDGRTVQLTVANNTSANVLSGGPLTHEYQLAMTRFHWSTDDTTGSEHQIDGKSYPLEVQLLHWNKTLYANIGQALTGEQGICILAVFYQIGDEDHDGLKEILRLLARYDHKGCFSTEVKTSIDPAGFIPECVDYWTYQGSLTTPPLTENVTWIVCQSPMFLTAKQMEVFRSVRTTNGEVMACNSRPLCPTNNRAIRASDITADITANGNDTIVNGDDQTNAEIIVNNEHDLNNSLEEEPEN